MPNILLVVKHAQQEMDDARAMHRIALETSTTSEIAEGKTARGATAGGDERKLRGLPCIARGVQGAIPGSAPGGNDITFAPRHWDPIEDTGWE